MMEQRLRLWLARCLPWSRAANALRAPISLGIRLFVADVFFRAGMTKLADWDVTLALFTDEYQVPLLPPELAAVLATLGEILLPMLLSLGLATRLAALGLFVLNLVAVISYPTMPEIARQFHVYWGMLLALLLAYGGGAWSVDRFLLNRLHP
jgi:putative oxidoreductase